MLSIKRTLWIGTEVVKDLYRDIGKEKKPFLALVTQLIRRGVEVRLIHAIEPGPNFCEDFDKYPVLYDRLERVLCPQFDEVGIGKHCKKCKLKGSCPDPY